MALKRWFSEQEKYGLTQEEIRIAEKYLRKHKTAGALGDLESAKLFELYLIGASFHELANQFPQHQLPQIILTAALRGWAKDRDLMMWSLKDRVRAKVIKSILEQVDFLSSMLAVSNTEHVEKMKGYILHPDKNPLPTLRIESIKEYKEVVETLQRIVAGVPGAKASSLMDALAPGNQPKLGGRSSSASDPEQLTAELVELNISDIEMK